MIVVLALLVSSCWVSLARATEPVDVTRFEPAGSSSSPGSGIVAVSGSLTVWVEQAGKKNQAICAFDQLSQKSYRTLTTGCGAGAIANIDVSGEIVVFDRGDAVWSCNVVSGSDPLKLSGDLPVCHDPAIDGTLVVWEQTGSSTGTDIWGRLIGRDGTVGSDEGPFPICTQSDGQQNPDVSFDVGTPNYYAITGWDLSTQTPNEWVGETGREKRQWAIVVWQDNRADTGVSQLACPGGDANGTAPDWDIYAAAVEPAKSLGSGQRLVDLCTAHGPGDEEDPGAGPAHATTTSETPYDVMVSGRRSDSLNETDPATDGNICVWTDAGASASTDGERICGSTIARRHDLLGLFPRPEFALGAGQKMKMAAPDFASTADGSICVWRGRLWVDHKMHHKTRKASWGESMLYGYSLVSKTQFVVGACDDDAVPKVSGDPSGDVVTAFGETPAVTANGDEATRVVWSQAESKRRFVVNAARLTFTVAERFDVSTNVITRTTSSSPLTELSVSVDGSSIGWSDNRDVTPLVTDDPRYSHCFIRKVLPSLPGDPVKLGPDPGTEPSLGDKADYWMFCDQSGDWQVYKGRKTVTVGNKLAQKFDVYLHNEKTGVTICPTDGTHPVADGTNGESFGGNNNPYPRISNNLVVWVDGRNGEGNGDIYGYDIAQDRQFPVATGPSLQWHPDVSVSSNGDYNVVWVDERDLGFNSVVVSDFNSDGKMDQATAYCYADCVGVRLGSGDGTFGAESTFQTGANPASIAVGDFDTDGKKDLVTANCGAGTVSVLLGNGSGGFGDKTDCATGDDPYSIAVGDFNTDGRADLVTASRNAHAVSVLLGDGGGGFGAKTDYATGDDPVSVAVDDFNEDGIQDLVTANLGANSVSVLLGNGSSRTGNGSFGNKVDYATGSMPRSVVVGDFDGDGIQDLATANSAKPPMPDLSTVTVLRGNGSAGTGTGTFANSGSFCVGDNPVSIAVGDFNGDSKQDLVTANCHPDWTHHPNANSTVSVLLNTTSNGHLDFDDEDETGSKRDFVTQWYPVAVAVGDLDGQGGQDVVAVDLVTTDQGTGVQNKAGQSVLLNRGTGSTWSDSTLQTSAYPSPGFDACVRDRVWGRTVKADGQATLPYQISYPDERDGPPSAQEMLYGAYAKHQGMALIEGDLVVWREDPWYKTIGTDRNAFSERTLGPYARWDGCYDVAWARRIETDGPPVDDEFMLGPTDDDFVWPVGTPEKNGVVTNKYPGEVGNVVVVLSPCDVVKTDSGHEVVLLRAGRYFHDEPAGAIYNKHNCHDLWGWDIQTNTLFCISQDDYGWLQQSADMASSGLVAWTDTRFGSRDIIQKDRWGNDMPYDGFTWWTDGREANMSVLGGSLRPTLHTLP